MIISLTFFFYYVFNVMIKSASTLLQIDKPIKIWLMVFLMTLTLIFLIKQRERILQLIENHKPILILVSVLSFAVMHVLNYKIKEFTIEAIVGLFLILLPIPFIGYLLTYIRIRNGLAWSFALHVINNSLILVPVVFGSAKI
jgi:hypothetical protein